MAVEIDHTERRALVIAVDDGHRTTITLQHQDGVELFKQIQEYYGRLEFGQGDETPDKKGLLARMIAKFLPPAKKES